MDIDEETKVSLVRQIKTGKEATIEDFDLSFYNPVNDKIELIADGANVPVTLDNLQMYIDLVVDSLFNESIKV